MPTWNPQQLKAIETKQKNVLVSASAGAGKTTVLIARLVDLVLKERIGIDHILAMTFTEAAANEMKKRLAAELHSLLQGANDEAEQQYIMEQLTAIQTAHISTIHSFCLSIIQEFYYMIGLPSTAVSNIMDDATSANAKAQAMEEVFAKQYEQQDDAFYQLTSMFSARAESDDALRLAIMSVASNASAQSDPDAWLDRCLSMYEPVSTLLEFPKPLVSLFFDDLHVQSELYETACMELNDRYTKLYPEETKKADLMQKKCDALPTLFTALDAKDYTAFREAFIAICHIVAPPSPDKEDKVYLRLRKRIIALEDTMLERLYEESTLCRDIKELYGPIKKLIELCRDYRQAFQRIKWEMGCIDFDDMEHFALAILQVNDGQIAKHYQALFDEIMVDEFQDSNDVQNELVRLICRENNVFRVGDIKQSIYGFRHAKPQLMRGLIDQAGPLDEVIYLSNNYRSKKIIVDFNNELFKELMNLDGFTCSYAKEDDVETGVPAQKEGNVPIVFHAIDAENIKFEEDLFCTSNELKASYIAKQIVIIKEEEQRQWKDFVVLVRANARKQDLKQIFDSWNIPYFIDVRSGFYSSNAISIILSALHALVNPYSEISFIATLTSPLFCMGMHEIADIKLTKGDEGYYSYMKQIEHPILTSFEELRSMIYRSSICDLLNALYNTNDFYDQHTTTQERTNLDLLFENAIAFEQQEGKGILAFLQTIDSVKEMESGEAIPIGSEDDVVRVMSIHQSKGLQFPVVFLWSNMKQVAIEFKDLMICDSDLGIAMKHMEIENRTVRPTLHRMAMEHKKDQEELEEEMRILYVATTRAQTQMHIVDCIKSLEEYEAPLTTSTVYQRGGYTSWILHSSLAHTNSPLFNIKPVTHLWSEEIQEKEGVTSHILPLYHGEDTPWELTTPSAFKHAKELPSLSFTSKAAMKHGTQLHEWIERLPLRPWTVEEVQALPNITPTDLQALMKLSENPLYRKACTYPSVYHELPFMVKETKESILHGYLDFMAMSEEEIIIIDFKTDALTSEQELIKRYQDQLLGYEKAMHLIYPKHHIHTYIYSLKLHKEIAVTKTAIHV